MNKKDLFISSFLSSFGVFVYVFLLVLGARYGERIVNYMPDVLGMMLFLLLFVLSAGVTGSLILGKPVMLYLDQKRKEALYVLGAHLLWLLIFVCIIILIAYFFGDLFRSHGVY